MYSSHKKKNKKVEGVVPCGNPKRYGSRDVVHMPPFGSSNWKHKNVHSDDSSATETEKHLQTLLNNQIKTDVTLLEQFSQHRTFSLATSHDPEVRKLAGVNNYEDYTAVNDLDNRIDFFRHCGLDNGEITLKLTEELKDKVPITRGGYGIDPQSKIEKLKEIERKIQEKTDALKVPDTFKGALELSRQALELEKSQDQRVGKESSLIGIITTQKKPPTTHPDDPVNHIHEMLLNLDGKKVREPRRERRKRRKLEQKRLYYAAFDDDPSNSLIANDHHSLIEHSNGNLNNLGSSDKVLSSKSVFDQQILPSTYKVEADEGCFITKQSCSQNHFDLHKSLKEHSKIDKKSKEESMLLSSETITSPSAPSAKIVHTISAPVQLIGEDEIARNRLSLEEIRGMDKFEKYTEGEPNNIIYVKNLPINTTEKDLVALFGSFQSQEKPKLLFKLLTGRMKGQAFITFPDVQTASKALQLVNGYILRDKPIILSFGKKQRR